LDRPKIVNLTDAKNREHFYAKWAPLRVKKGVIARGHTGGPLITQFYTIFLDVCREIVY
jgi:hypothetical protein